MRSALSRLSGQHFDDTILDTVDKMIGNSCAINECHSVPSVRFTFVLYTVTSDDDKRVNRHFGLSVMLSSVLDDTILF